MSLSLVTNSTAEPVSLAEARAHVRVSHSLEDARLANYLLVAREYAETYTRRCLMTRTFDLTIDRAWPVYWDADCKQWAPGIILPRPPFQSVTSISYIDPNGAPQTLAPDQYQAFATNGDSREGLVVPAYNVTWPQIRPQMQAITVRFVAGYNASTEIPERVRQAILLLVGHWFERREDAISGTTITSIPKGADDLLDSLRVFY